MKNILHYLDLLNYREILILFFVVSIPISLRINVLTTVFLTLDLIYLLFFEKKVKLLNYRLLSMMLLYLSSVLGLLYTSNFTYAGSILETRFTLLLFPLLLVYSPSLLNRRFLNRVFIFFVFATFAGSMFLLSRAFVLYLSDFNRSHFFYAYLTGNFHPSYYSMYVSFSIAVLIFVPISFLPKWLSCFGLLFFSIMVFLLMSKMGIIVLFILFIYAIIVKSNWHNLLLKLSLFVLFSSLLLVFLYQYSTFFNYKIDNTFKELSTLNQSQRKRLSSTGMRILLWRVSLDLVKDNVLIGVGTGDAGDELLKAKVRRGWEDKVHGLNAHSQFFQTAIALGLIGLLILVFFIFYPLFLAFKQKEHLFVLFFILIILNFMVESMLQRQMGVIFFALFASLIYGFLVSKPTSLSN